MALVSGGTLGPSTERGVTAGLRAGRAQRFRKVAPATHGADSSATLGAMGVGRAMIGGTAALLVVTACTPWGSGGAGEGAGTGACSAEPGASVPAGADWAVGDARQLEVRTAVSADEAPDLSLVDGNVVSLRITGDGDLRTAVWESANSTLIDLLVLPAGFAGEVERTGSAVPGDRFEYLIDGNAVSIVDLDRMRQNVLDLLDQLQLDGALDAHSTLRNQMSVDDIDDATLSGLLIRRPTIYHVLDGHELDRDVAVSFPDVLPNGFGGEPFPATSTVLVEGMLDDEGCVSIVQRTVPEPNAFRRIFAAEIERRGAPTSGPVFEAALEEFSIERRYIGQFDGGTGRLWRIRGEQITQAGQQRQHAVTEITDVTPG